MPRSAAFDPVDRFRWRVYVVSPAGAVWARAGFSTCSSPGVTVNYESYAEGGSHMNPKKIHAGAAFKPITLTRGLIAKNGTDDFAVWMEDLYRVVAAEPNTSGQAAQYRNNIVIEQLDRDASVVKRWTLYNCVPTRYEPASDFSATDDAGVSIETLSFEYEGFDEERPSWKEDVGKYARRFTRGIF